MRGEGSGGLGAQARLQRRAGSGCRQASAAHNHTTTGHTTQHDGRGGPPAHQVVRVEDGRHHVPDQRADPEQQDDPEEGMPEAHAGGATTSSRISRSDHQSPIRAQSVVLPSTLVLLPPASVP
eukprot:3523085-Pyramimonas_sp.AAC.1